ncbi:unnamed protein product [Thelazia callipaeda]|uniref:Piwi domain-containing protein n=1 Tax=Thelazia callipaeda TaxID=103827 RepID=A0A0N5CPG6_THECL|nr:unnamed protein product [Thelazia callipaeda]
MIGGRGESSGRSTSEQGPSGFKAKSRGFPASGHSRKVKEKSSKEISDLIPRPGHGKIGVPINLKANFKILNIPASLQLYCYHINVWKTIGQDQRSIKDREVCSKIFWDVVTKNKEVFGNGYSLVYDDSHVLFSGNRLNINSEAVELKLIAKSKSVPISFTLEVVQTNCFTLTADERSPNFRMSMQFLDCLVTQRVRCPYMNIASSFHSFQQYMFLKPYEGIPWNILDVGPGMEAWTGLYGAVKRCEKGLLLNVDGGKLLSTKVFYKVDMPLIDFYLAVLNEFSGRRDSYKVSSIGGTFAMSAHQRQQLKNALMGLTLKLTYDDRHVKFLDVGQPARIQRFELKRGEESLGQVTVEDYFRRYKNIILNFPNLPVLYCGKVTMKNCFPMELLRLSDKVQRVKRRLTPFQIAKLIKGTAVSPLERFKKIDWILKGMRMSSEDEFIQQFGIVFPTNSAGYQESILIPGRVLPSPVLKFRFTEPAAINAEKLQQRELQAKNGSWPLQGEFLETAAGIHVAVVIVNQAVTYNTFKDPFKTLLLTCKRFGMQFARKDLGPDNVDVYCWNTKQEEVDEYIQKFKSLCFKLKNIVLKPLVIFIVPEKEDDTYGRIKVACDKEEGIACQVILAKTFLKMGGDSGRNSVAHNICLKINVKLGGINNEISKNQEYWKKFSDAKESTLFIGIDVTHPLYDEHSFPSVAAIVGSLNVDATRYAATIKIQHSKQEVGLYIVDALQARIIDFNVQTGSKPEHIVIFRDGVSDSQFFDVSNEELFCLKAAINQLDKMYNPTVSYVVIQKRHHTRLIEAIVDAAPRTDRNIPPGTVVDSTITSPSHFDFYLCSHQGAIGTSRPSHYIVLYDSWLLSADEWQQMIYALCHVYARCNKSVSIPAPVYYAHLACDRARRILKYARIDVSQKAGVSSVEKSFMINEDTPKMYFV